MSKPKSRVTVTNRRDGVVIRATGIYASNLIAILLGKSTEQPLAGLQADAIDCDPPENSHSSTNNGKDNA